MARKLNTSRKDSELQRLSERGPKITLKVNKLTPGTSVGMGNPKRTGSGKLPKPSSVRKKG